MDYLELDRLIECIPYGDVVRIEGLDGDVLYRGTVRDLRKDGLDDDVLIADVLRVEIENDEDGQYIAINVYC